MKILFLAANPESTSRLNLEKEAREIQEALEISELAKEFELIQRWEVRPKDFRRALLRYKPDIVHFSGHGRGKSGLVITDDGGKSKAVTGNALAGLFAAFPMVKCVLLNACYAEMQAKAIVRHVDYVIGMKDTIYDKAAIAFSIGFYDSLGYGRDIETAFDLGKNAILWEYKHDSGETRQMIPVEPTEATEDLPEHLKPVLLKKASLVTSETKQKLPTSASGAKTDAEQIFRDRVQKYLDERKLTPIAKFQLGNLAKEQGISESEANSILESGLQKIEEDKKIYQKLLQETIAVGLNPFDSPHQQELKSLQQYLKLTDGEVAAILAATRAKNETEQVEEDRTVNDKSQPERIINIYQGNYNESIAGDYIQGNRGEDNQAETNLEETPNKKLDRESKIQKFSFEVVTVDETGKENSRTTKEAEFYREDLGNGVILDMVKIPSGEFMMGSPGDEGYDQEKPQHKVKVPSFWLGKYPVTQEQWQAIMGNNPSYFTDNLQNPVERVSWNDAQKFCQQLTQTTGNKYCLPSEAEWEYACRAGTKTPFHFGDTISTEFANYRGTHREYQGTVYPGNYGKGLKGIYREKTTPVGHFQVANNFGVYDLHGNVWEWCEDDWHENYEGAPNDGSAWRAGFSSKIVIRGGSWFDGPDCCRSAFRGNYSREGRGYDLGFRVACVAPRTT